MTDHEYTHVKIITNEGPFEEVGGENPNLDDLIATSWAEKADSTDTFSRRDEAALAGRMAAEMQYKLSLNRHKPHWVGTDVELLIGGLLREVHELIEAVSTGEGIWLEAADVANYAAMIADRLDE